MRDWSLGGLAALASLAVWGLPPALAEDAYPAVRLLDTTTTVVGEPIRYPDSGPARVTAQVVTLAPGAATVVHHHPAPMVAYILDGEVTVDYGADGRRTYHAGEAFMEAMTVPHHGVNTGAVPVRILAVSLGAEGTRTVAVDEAPDDAPPASPKP